MSSWRRCNRDWLQSTGTLTKMTYKAPHDAGCAEKSLIKAKKWPSFSCLTWFTVHECSVILLVNIISMLENLSNTAKGSRQNCSPCFLVEASFVIQCDSLHAINQQLSHWTSIFVTVCLWVQSVFTFVVRFIWSKSVDELWFICIFPLVQFGLPHFKQTKLYQQKLCGSCHSVHWSEITSVCFVFFLAVVLYQGSSIKTERGPVTKISFQQRSEPHV